MLTATLTSRGQITIPKQVRESLRLRSGDRVTFIVHDETEAVLKPVATTVDQVFGMLHRPGQIRRNVAEMNRAVAHRARGRRP